MGVKIDVKKNIKQNMLNPKNNNRNILFVSTSTFY